MSTQIDHPPETRDDERRVTERTAQLLEGWDPQSTSPRDLWGAQFDLGLAWVHFPVGLGGLDVAPRLQEVVNAALRSAGAPSNALRNFIGIGTAAPTIVAYGTEEQKHRLLRPTFTCDEIWCQLFSEPSAGSDLASLATQAERDGDEWVVNGHKIWTSMGHIARWGILIARSDPHVPKHRGLTYFLLDMQTDGVEVRPLRQISGEAEFNEVILHDVRIADDMRLGEPGEGWRVTMATLMSERAHNGDLATRQRGLGPIAHAMRVWRQTGGSPVARDRLLQLWVQAEVVRLTSLRAAQQRESGVRGPEGSILKLAVGAFPQHVMDLCLELLGPAGMLIDNYNMDQPDVLGEDRMGDGTTPVDIAKAFLNARSSTIGGGTTEVQRTTIAERVLGLPAEPRPDRDRPWDAS
jgi:alkylation response protein AidB-like acyl-CoA dehydrogenase